MRLLVDAGALNVKVHSAAPDRSLSVEKASKTVRENLPFSMTASSPGKAEENNNS